MKLSLGFPFLCAGEFLWFTQAIDSSREVLGPGPPPAASPRFGRPGVGGVEF